MENDWFKLWRELVIINTPSSSSALVSRYKAHMVKKNRGPDDLLNFVLERISNEHTVLDIGAGGGRWTIPIASIAGTVTALEPSADMRDILRDNIDEEAFARDKKHLHLEASSVYDGRIRDMLKRRLVVSDNGYMWPDGMRSALLWWTPRNHLEFSIT